MNDAGAMKTTSTEKTKKGYTSPHMLWLQEVWMKDMEAKGVDKSEAVLMGGKEWEKMDMQEKNIWRKKANKDWVEEDIDYENSKASAEDFDQDFNINNISTNEESSTKNNNLNSKNSQMGPRKRKIAEVSYETGSNKKP